ncbi:tyrosine-type recombinase/integrase [Ureibacillus sp. FSL K6-3587]|uniref:tyrosine-type recombinase/integrase n=1 Tax=Ureibacillus sp. FSL K6-3587 TaxID=2954681 RepID=UPI0031589FE5
MMESQQVLDHYENEIDIFKTYLEDLGYSPYTIKCYLSDVQSFLTFLIEKEEKLIPLDTVGSKNIQEYLRKTQKGKAKTTRNRRLMSLRTFFKSLVKAEELNFNPALEIDIAKTEKNPLPTYLNDEELRLLFQCIKHDQYHIRNKCILMLMSLAGLRVIEIYHLNTSDLIRDENEPGINVMGKGSKARYIPLPAPLFHLLMEYEHMYRPTPKQEHRNAFFVSKRGERLSRRRIQMISEEAFNRLKSLPDFHYLQSKKLSSHKLRHTFGTRLVREGVDLVTVQELMGHTNLSTTQIYTHVNNKQKQEAMRNQNVAKFFE